MSLMSHAPQDGTDWDNPTGRQDLSVPCKLTPCACGPAAAAGRLILSGFPVHGHGTRGENPWPMAPPSSIDEMMN